MSKFDFIDKIKRILSKEDPNQIKSISCNFDILNKENQDFTYTNLINYWKTQTDKEDELYQEYNNINNFESDKGIGVVSLFYFKDNKKFLAIGKQGKDLFHFDLKCPQYQKVLSNAITSDNEIFVLTYWIL